MATKTLVVLALLLASAVLLATAAEQAHDKADKGTTNNAGLQDWNGGGGYPGHGGGYPGHGGGYPGGHGGGYPGGHGCRWGCCGGGYHGGCRCCAHADEIPEPMYRPEAEVHN